MHPARVDWNSAGRSSDRCRAASSSPRSTTRTATGRPCTRTSVTRRRCRSCSPPPSAASSGRRHRPPTSTCTAAAECRSIWRPASAGSGSRPRRGRRTPSSSSTMSRGRCCRRATRPRRSRRSSPPYRAEYANSLHRVACRSAAFDPSFSIRIKSVRCHFIDMATQCRHVDIRGDNLTWEWDLPVASRIAFTRPPAVGARTPLGRGPGPGFSPRACVPAGWRA